MWHASILAFLGYVVAQESGVEFSQLPSEYKGRHPDLAVNETYRSPQESRDINMGVAVERVLLSNCDNWKSHTSRFYREMIVNTAGYKQGNRVHKVSLANKLQSELGFTISSTSGIYTPPQSDTYYYTWETIRIMAWGQDVRERRPPVLMLNVWVGMPQIFFPLYLNDEATGDAYMLHIYPDPQMLSDPLNVDRWHSGVLWTSSKDSAPLYNLRIDIAGLIENIQDMKVVNYIEFFEPSGPIFRDRSQTQTSAYPDFAQYTLQATTLGTTTEYPCNYIRYPSTITWSVFEKLLKREYSWL